jgi:hypothetical protein
VRAQVNHGRFLIGDAADQLEAQQDFKRKLMHCRADEKRKALKARHKKLMRHGFDEFVANVVEQCHALGRWPRA